MLKTLDAVFDGTVLHPVEPLALKPNTRVRITIETEPAKQKQGSFLQTARSLELAGPSDWSENVEEYLYGNKPSDE